MQTHAWLAVLVVATGCTRAEVPARREPTHTTSTTLAAEPAPLRPLEGPWIQRVEIKREGKTEVTYLGVPVGATDRRAVLVGVHGAGDRADWSCSEWMATMAHWGFVVCPEGLPHAKYRGTFVWGSAAAIADQADRAVALLRERYGEWIADGPLVYGGWSQGATLAADVVSSRKGLYDRVILVEVGHTPLDPTATVDRLTASGVRRAVVSCSSAKCRAFAQGFDARARRRGLSTRTNDVGDRGHWFDEPVFRTLSEKVVWLVEDEPRYLGLASAVDARWLTE